MNWPRGSWFECFFCKTAKKLFVTGFMEENETLAYQYEDARETKLWKKVIAVILAAVLVIGALVELLCQTSMMKNRLEVSAMMSGYTRDIVDTTKAASIDKETMA